MSLYRDLHISNGDVVLDAGLNPAYLTDRAAIAQDIVCLLYTSDAADE